MTIKTRIHDMIDVCASIKNKTDADVSFAVKTKGNDFTFVIETFAGSERFEDVDSAEAWLADTVAAIGSEADKEVARELQVKNQEIKRFEALIAQFEARVVELNA